MEKSSQKLVVAWKDSNYWGGYARATDFERSDDECGADANGHL